MKTAFEIDTILFKLLNGKLSINGGIFKGDDRPEDSNREDVVVNTIDAPQDALPQFATSNVNVYVADTTKKINGKMQISANKARLESLTNEVLSLLRDAQINGMKIIVANHTIMYEQATKQHFSNIRIDWNIQI